MRNFASALFVLCCAVPILVAAAGDKQLQNVKGSVSYQRSGGSQHPVARSATIVLVDNDFAITGDASIAAVVLPDSSRVTMGSDTKVQLAFFNAAERNNAKFILYNGRTRFKVEHPNGKPANYVFQTPTAQIAVRGTEGDIGVDGKNLTVNVYGLTDPNLPVVVTTEDGKHFALKAGQQLLANWVHGQIQTQINRLTSQMVAQFGELGAPVSNWAGAVANLPQTVTNNVTSNIPGAGLIPSLGFGHHASSNANAASPGPSASPCPTVAPQGGLSGFLHKLSGQTPACASPSPSPSP